jgi:hypothetical protein
MNKRVLILGLGGFALIIILVLMIFAFEDDLNNSYVCAKYREFKKEKWEGVITKKYVDNTNHNAETFEIQNKPYAMFRDGTDFYNFIIIGDSAVKSLNTDIIKVYRQGCVNDFKIYFDCNE